MRTLPSTRHLLVSISAICAAAFSPANAQPKLKVLISADMEGVTGVTSWNTEAQPRSRDYGQFRELFTKEVNAAISGAYDAGATEVIVADSHGDYANLDPETLDQRARLIRGGPRPFGMMQGIARDVDAVAFIGFHAPEGEAGAILPHTFTGSLSLRLNGVWVSEGSFDAAIAGSFGVPVVFLSGDSAAAADALKFSPAIETAVVKEAVGIHSGLMLSPQKARDLIRDRCARGVKGRHEIKPYVVSTPVNLEVRFKDIAAAELVSYLPGAERSAADTVRLPATDMAQAAKLMTVINTLAAVSHD